MLVAGSAAAICSDCVQLAVEAISGPIDRLAAARAALDRAIEDLTAKASFADSGALIRAAVALSGGDPARCKGLAQIALNLDNPEAAIEALSRIPEAQLDNGARIAMAVASCYARDFARGHAAIARVTGDDPQDRMLVVINRAALALTETRGPGRAPGDLRAIEADLLKVRPIADALVERDQRHLAQTTSLEVNLAEIALRSGDAARAARMLEDIERRLSWIHPTTHLVLGDALHAMGKARQARERWKKALDGAHPESHVAAEARARLDPG